MAKSIQQTTKSIKRKAKVILSRKTTVTYYSPGTLFAEVTVKKIPSGKNLLRNAVKEANKITERYGAKPYAFNCKGRTYYLPHNKVIKKEDIPKTKENEIIIGNCERNNYDKIVQTTEGWRSTQPFNKKDVVLNEDGTIRERYS